MFCRVSLMAECVGECSDCPQVLFFRDSSRDPAGEPWVSRYPGNAHAQRDRGRIHRSPVRLHSILCCHHRSDTHSNHSNCSNSSALVGQQSPWIGVRMELSLKNAQQLAAVADHSVGPHELPQCRPFEAPNVRPCLRVAVCFVQVAGHSLFRKYKKQFYKVLLYIYSRFLVRLATSSNTESQAVYSRLQTYLQNQQFSKPPEGKSMPHTAASFRVHT